MLDIEKLIEDNRRYLDKVFLEKMFNLLEDFNIKDLCMGCGIPNTPPEIDHSQYNSKFFVEDTTEKSSRFLLQSCNIIYKPKDLKISLYFTKDGALSDYTINGVDLSGVFDWDDYESICDKLRKLNLRNTVKYYICVQKLVDEVLTKVDLKSALDKL